MADRKRILIADDDPDLLELLRMDLSLLEYEIKTATNGKDALELATKSAFDLIILDVMMPYIDGYHVASELTNKLGANAPTIMIMTNRDTRREQGVAMMSGATAVMQKPFSMVDLHKKIEEILEKD